jgi:glycolate oxidase FAD binding subunit
VAVLPSRVVEVAGGLGEAEGFDVAVVSQPGYGMSQVCWFGDRDGPPDRTQSILDKARDAVRNLEGSLIIERCPLDAKADFDVWGDVGEPIRIMRGLKEQYDPKGIINPGRYVGRI